MRGVGSTVGTVGVGVGSGETGATSGVGVTVAAAVGPGSLVVSFNGVTVAWTRGGNGLVGVGESGGGSQQPLRANASTIIPSIVARSVFRYLAYMITWPMGKGAASGAGTPAPAAPVQQAGLICLALA